MTEQIHHLANRIRSELKELERILLRVTKGWESAKRSSDDLYVDSVALNLHGLYSGIEKLFELIAAKVDGKMPKGKNWHKLLLQQMTSEIHQVRPAVISENVNRLLDDYRGFRHIVRNVYTFMFDMSKMEKLVVEAPALFNQIKGELSAFAEFLDVSVNCDDN